MPDVHERASVSPTVKNVMSPSASLRRTTTSSRADAPARNSAASSSESCELHLEGAVDPAGPFSSGMSGFVVSGSSSREIARPLRRRVAFVEVREQALGELGFLPLCAVARLRLLADASSRRSTCSRSATMSSRRSVSRSAPDRRRPRSRRARRGARRLTELAGDLGAPRDVDDADRCRRHLLRADDLGEPVEAVVGDHRHPEVRLLRDVRIGGHLRPARVSALKSVVFPELGRPTMPTRSATRR